MMALTRAVAGSTPPIFLILLLLQLYIKPFASTLISVDVFQFVLGHVSDDELYDWYFCARSFKAFRALIGIEIIQRSHRLTSTLTLKQYKKLRNSFNQNNQTEHERIINQEIQRLAPVQSHILPYSDASIFRNCSFLQNKDLRGIEFSNNASSLDLSHNKIGSLHGIHFGANLRTLKLRSNNIKTLNGIVFPKRLEVLFISDNPIIGALDNLPSTLQKLIIGRCSNLTSLLVPRYLRILSIYDSGIISPDQLIMKDNGCLQCIYVREGCLRASNVWRHWKTNLIASNESNCHFNCLKILLWANPASPLAMFHEAP